MYTQTHTRRIVYILFSRSSSWKIEFTGKMVNDQLQNNERINTYTKKNTTISFEMYLFPIFVENLFHFAYQLNFSPICLFIWNVVSGLGAFFSILSLYLSPSLATIIQWWIFAHSLRLFVHVCMRLFKCVLAHAYSLFFFSLYIYY